MMSDQKLKKNLDKKHQPIKKISLNEIKNSRTVVSKATNPFYPHATTQAEQILKEQNRKYYSTVLGIINIFLLVSLKTTKVNYFLFILKIIQFRNNSCPLFHAGFQLFSWQNQCFGININAQQLK
jgi:hypothetical protein